MKLGARAYLVGSELDKELLGTIRAVYDGKYRLSADPDDEERYVGFASITKIYNGTERH
jgi:hypothetical protein